MKVQLQEIRNNVEIGFEEKNISYEAFNNTDPIEAFNVGYAVELTYSFYDGLTKVTFFVYSGIEVTNANVTYLISVSV